MSQMLDADVCVVGAGIVGLAHALEARGRGLSVVVVERDAAASGASVRNFGHVCVSAMADGLALEAALEARERWLSLAASAGLEISQAGTVIVARAEDELAVLSGVASDPRRAARLVSAEAVGRLAPISTRGVVGGLLADRDLRVNPRRAVACLARALESDRACHFVWGSPVHTVEPGRVHAAAVVVSAPLTVICPGPDFTALPPGLRPQREGLTRCRLQMLRARAPAGRRYGPALLTGLSLLRYPAFAAQPGFASVQARLSRERPELLEAGIHLIITQLPDGDLIIGDTHDYGLNVSPFRSERLDRLLLVEAAALLGVDALEVRERWLGVYPFAPGEPFLVSEPMPGVRVVGVVAGIGMTTALGLAPRVLDELLEAQPAA